MNTIQVNHLGHISNISQHLFNFIPDEWNSSHMRLCKYKRSCLPADSTAWQHSLMTTVCYFEPFREVLPPWRQLWSLVCEAWGSLPPVPAIWSQYRLCARGTCATRPALLGSGGRSKSFWKADNLCEKKGADPIVTLRASQELHGGLKAFPGWVSFLSVIVLLQMNYGRRK